MQTAGKILRGQRRKRSLTLDQVEEEIKIKKKFLKFLEEDNLEKLPSETYARGFLKNYAEFLGIPSEKILAIFRRQFRRRERTPLLLERLSKESFFKITPQRVKWGLTLILLVLFFGYLLKQYQSLAHGPALIITEPKKNIVTRGGKILIRGRTDPDARVFINNEEIYPDKNGDFFQEISLSKGINQVVISAENKMGRTKTVLREVTLESP